MASFPGIFPDSRLQLPRDSDFNTIHGESCLISALGMEGIESESVFDSLNLNPQLFVNEVLNAADDLVDGAFDFYKQQASGLMGKMGGGDRSAALNQKERGEEGRDGDKEKEEEFVANIGVSLLFDKIQSTLDKKMGMWEKYCLQHCFDVPDGFSLLKAVGLPHNCYY
ncbi:hypothetical protein ACLOJK_007704 [Asimina triloba]